MSSTAPFYTECSTRFSFTISRSPLLCGSSSRFLVREITRRIYHIYFYIFESFIIFFSLLYTFFLPLPPRGTFFFHLTHVCMGFPPPLSVVVSIRFTVTPQSEQRAHTKSGPQRASTVETKLNHRISTSTQQRPGPSSTNYPPAQNPGGSRLDPKSKNHAIPATTEQSSLRPALFSFKAVSEFVEKKKMFTLFTPLSTHSHALKRSCPRHHRRGPEEHRRYSETRPPDIERENRHRRGFALRQAGTESNITFCWVK